MPAAIIDNATRPNQRVVVGTLGTLAAKARAAELSGPSIIIVGTVVTLRNTLDWRPAAEPRSFGRERPLGRGEREGLRWFLATRSWRRWRRSPARTGARLCPNSGAVSGVTIRDGKVFAAIAIDPARAKAMEPMRAEAEAAIRAIPGVAGAVVTLTAEAARGRRRRFARSRP